MTKKISNPLCSAAVGATKKSLAVKKRLRSGLGIPGEKLKGIKEEAREAYEKEKREKAARPKKKKTTVREKGIAVKKRLRSGLGIPGEKLKENRAVASIKKTREEVEKLDSYIEEFEKKLVERKAPAAPKKPAPKAKKVAKKPVEEEVPETSSKKVVKDELAWIYSSQ